MKFILVAAALLTSGSAFAFSSLDHSCQEAHDAVMANGAMIIHTGPDLYDRYVSHDAYCELNQRTQPAWIPTMDSDACFVGYTCVNQSDGGSF